MIIRKGLIGCMFFSCLVIWGCNTKEAEEFTQPKEVITEGNLLSLNLEDYEVYNRVYDRALWQGDSHAYHRLFGFEYGKNNRFDKVFYYSFVFANRYRYGDAYYHLWCGLTGEKGIDSLDTGIKYFALYCLAKSSELGSAMPVNSINSYESECNCKLKSSREYLTMLGDLK